MDRRTIAVELVRLAKMLTERDDLEREMKRAIEKGEAVEFE